MGIQLTEEQKLFLEKALVGKNILVDACIGSGKTTAIQILCQDHLQGKHVLYLTYNRLLRLDAKDKINPKNVFVTNYHGFAMKYLKRRNKYVSISDCIEEFVENVWRGNIQIEKYDVLIIDEYQDIEQETADLLQVVKNASPNMQIIAVGDMQQKIYPNVS